MRFDHNMYCRTVSALANGPNRQSERHPFDGSEDIRQRRNEHQGER